MQVCRPFTSIIQSYCPCFLFFWISEQLEKNIDSFIIGQYFSNVLFYFIYFCCVILFVEQALSPLLSWSWFWAYRQCVWLIVTIVCVFVHNWVISIDFILFFFSTGGDYGGTGSKVFSAKPDCVLHHGGGRWTETSDRPGRGLQTNVGLE